MELSSVFGQLIFVMKRDYFANKLLTFANKINENIESRIGVYAESDFSKIERATRFQLGNSSRIYLHANVYISQIECHLSYKFQVSS